MKFGGGGHPFAAGITLKNAKLEPTVKKILLETSNSVKIFIGSQKK
jgi:nanoRNase/pAp phosphatase (c-di-AMP/oligoRNAs hydrolase)